MCSYNPLQPSPTYFTIGDAVSALAFLLAIQQFLKPIYRFRLGANGLKIRYLVTMVFLGALCSVVAALIPNLPNLNLGPLSYPIVWEFLGGFLIFLAYSTTAYISLQPARLHKYNITQFCNAGASLLSAATEEDRIYFAEDLLQGSNLERLVKYASAWERADHHATHLELERLQLAGLPQSFSGRAPISAFYLFAHRNELELADWAYNFMRILCDRDFCITLVKKSSWLTARALNRFKKHTNFTPAMEEFVQAVACQAILNEESMMAKEHGYAGFASAPVLSDSLFADRNFLRRYDPLRGLQFKIPRNPTEGFVLRLNDACEMILNAAVNGSDYWSINYAISLEIAYDSLSHHIAFDRSKNKKCEYLTHFSHGVDSLAKKITAGLSDMDAHRIEQLFVTEPDKFRGDLVKTVDKIIYSSLECVSNGFSGVDDDAWLHSHGLISEVYPMFGEEREGMNPLQQQLALQLIKKLRQNMEGWYPSISRVLLAVVGPYDRAGGSKKRTAFNILKDSVYFELKNLPELHKIAPEKIVKFLPPNVTYNPKSNTLTHTYTLGKKQVTNLSKLKISAVNLCDKTNWQQAAAN